MARGWRHTKLSLSTAALLLSISGTYVLCVIVSFFLSYLSCFLLLCFHALVVAFFRRFSEISLSSRPCTILATSYIAGYGFGPIS